MTRTLMVGLVLLTGSVSSAAAQAPVKPGMNAEQVTAAWGAPTATRTRGEYTYMSYPSTCMPACGTQDVVILKDGVVVDAVARSSNHVYDGKSSVGGKAPGFTDSTGVTTPAGSKP